MKRLVIGILAHVDSGKTTLSEGLLYCGGEIRKLGRVDHKDAFLDTHSLERERGITIFSKQAVIHSENNEITLLDTPGHIDFSAEMERTLSVLDYAILVISGSDGIQTHTRTLWQLLSHYKIPVFIFVNKMDIQGADKNIILKELRQKLSDSCCDFSITKNEEFYEEISLCDEQLMHEFLENNKIEYSSLNKCISERKIIPCFFGSALKLAGVEEFFNDLKKYTSAPPDKKSFSAKIFKISEDAQGNRLTHMKITGGSLKVKTMLSHGDNQNEKINHIRIYSGAKFQSVDEVFQGMVCAVTGLNETYAGEGIGDQQDDLLHMLEPVLTYKAQINDGTDITKAISAFRKLEAEDPSLHIMWNQQLGEIHIQIMGEIQLEVLKRLMAERFQIDTDFVHGNIAYKETIANAVEGVGHYEPLRHYAEVHLLLEPGKPGSGVQFFSDCREDDLDKNWQRLIMTHLHEKTHIGVLTGSPITDIKITLIAGRAHIKHTEGGDFRQATYRAVRQGLRSAESILLEPWYSYIIEIPSEYTGRAISDLTRMECSFSTPETTGDTTTISGTGPVASMHDYQTELTGYSRGQGKLMCSLSGYAPFHNTDEVTELINYSCDSDTENSCDSVFCSHGSGFVVKWDKVPEYMHINTGILKNENECNEEFKPKQKNPARTEFSRNIDHEKELMDIFERTYGKVNPEKKKNAFKSKREVQTLSTSYSAKPLPKGPEYLLVDGYNIIFAWDELRKIAATNLDLARSMLINTLCNYQGIRQCNIILVFDAYKVKGNTGETEKFYNISVVYTKEAETADTYIERVSHDLSHDHRVLVATSDALEQIIIFGNGAFRISATELYEEIKYAEKSIQDFLK